MAADQPLHSRQLCSQHLPCSISTQYSRRIGQHGWMLTPQTSPYTAGNCAVNTCMKY